MFERPFFVGMEPSSSSVLLLRLPQAAAARRPSFGFLRDVRHEGAEAARIEVLLSGGWASLHRRLEPGQTWHARLWVPRAAPLRAVRALDGALLQTWEALGDYGSLRLTAGSDVLLLLASAKRKLGDDR